MDNHPPIVVSSLDMARLTALLESPSYTSLPGIEALQSELDRAAVVEPDKVPPGVVTMNSTVRFVDDLSDATFELTLVYPNEAGPSDRVSILAPVGSALLGLSVGQSISWQIPGGRKLQVRILEVIYQPEADGEHRR